MIWDLSGFKSVFRTGQPLYKAPSCINSSIIPLPRSLKIPSALDHNWIVLYDKLSSQQGRVYTQCSWEESGGKVSLVHLATTPVLGCGIQHNLEQWPKIWWSVVYCTFAKALLIPDATPCIVRQGNGCHRTSYTLPHKDSLLSEENLNCFFRGLCVCHLTV